MTVAIAGNNIDISDLHWLMDMLQSIDVGLVVLDREYRVQVWNEFMVNHSGQRAAQVMGRSLFEAFPEVPEAVFRRKAEAVRTLDCRAFFNWQERPYLFRFTPYRPLSGYAAHMFQNATLIPLKAASGEIDHLGLIVYDVTDTAETHLALAASNRKLESLSRTDRLTGLYNRGHWEERLLAEFQRFRRTGQNCALMMFDIDHFKRVNDTHGHQAGDEVIRNTARTLQETIRATDVAGRYGGEEFAVILVDTTAEKARVVADRLRERIQASPVVHAGRAIEYTISVGLADPDAKLKRHEDWIERADSALYAAKEGGRNRTEVYHPDTGASGSSAA